MKTRLSIAVGLDISEQDSLHACENQDTKKIFKNMIRVFSIDLHIGLSYTDSNFFPKLLFLAM